MQTYQALFHDIMRAISLVLDFDESVKLHHASRVALLSYELAKAINVPDAALLYYGGLLHDIGGMGLRDHVLHHASRGFGDREAQGHAAMGARIVRPFSLLRPLEPFIADHHERFDGQGFPAGKRGAEIPMQASILLLADMLDIELRSMATATHPRAAHQVIHAARATAVPPQVADVAHDLLLARPELIDTMFDDAALSSALERLRPELPGVEGVTRTQLLSQLLWVLARIVDAKHASTMGHSTRVAWFAHKITEEFGQDVNQWDVVWSGFMHDLGKVGVPRLLLDKREPLTEEEWKVVRGHARDSQHIIAAIPDLAYLAYPAAAHHERYGGGGYPMGRAGESIPLIARILSYADIYDALTSARSYRSALSHRDAIATLRQAVGTALDPHLAEVALPVLDQIGTDTERLASEMQRFSRVFQSDEADVTQLLAPESSRGAAIRSVRKGVLLLGVEPWSRAVIDPQLRFLLGAEPWARATGEPASQDLVDHLDPPCAEVFRRACESLAPGRIYTRYFFTRKSRPLEVLLERNDGGITVLYRTADNRLQSMNRLALFYRNFLSSSEAVIFTDPDGTIIDVNRTFLDVYGYKLKDIVGQHSRILKSGKHAPEFYREMWHSVSDPNVGAWAGEIVDRKSNGEELYAQLTINSVRDSNGACIGYIGHAIDITDRKRTEQELERKNQALERVSRFKSDLMAMTSHDLKSPLVSIVNMASLMRDNLARIDPERMSGYLERIADSARQLTTFVNDLLDLESTESGSFRLCYAKVRLDGLLACCVEQIRAGLNRPVELRVRSPERAAAVAVAVDDARMEQVLMNLLSNAVKFAPAHSVVEAWCEEDGGERATIRIEDEGPGIPEEALEAIFDRYYQVAKKGSVPKRGFGTGLGLNIVKNLVALHGGIVRAENRPERGCRFTVEIPTRRSEPLMQRRVALVMASARDSDGLVATLAAMHLSPRVVDGPTDLKRGCQVLEPTAVFVHASFLDSHTCDMLRSWIQGAPEARLAVCITSDDSPSSVRFELGATLIAPVLDTEIRELLRDLDSSASACGNVS